MLSETIDRDNIKIIIKLIKEFEIMHFRGDTIRTENITKEYTSIREPLYIVESCLCK